MNRNSKFLYNFNGSFSDNFLPDFLEFPKEAIVPMDFSNPIESLFSQKCIISSASIFEIDQSLIIHMVQNLLGNQSGKSLAHFFHGQNAFSGTDQMIDFWYAIKMMDDFFL